MPTQRIEQVFRSELQRLEERGTRKGAESVIRAILPPHGERGPRYLLEGEGDHPFRAGMNG